MVLSHLHHVAPPVHQVVHEGALLRLEPALRMVLVVAVVVVPVVLGGVGGHVRVPAVDVVVAPLAPLRRSVAVKVAC